MTQEIKQIRIPYSANFSLGQIVATPGALEACNPHHLQSCLYQHSCGDCGEVCAETRR